MANTFQVGRQFGETLWDYLERRERELIAQTAAARSDLQTMETELAHVRSARRQIGNIPSFGQTPLAVPDSISLAPILNVPIAGTVANPLALATSNAVVENPQKKASNPPTIKDMILKALWTRFRDQGATQALLRQFIKDAYGRDIDRTSMSPQIARLRSEGLLKQKGDDDNWRLTEQAVNKFRTDLLYGQ